MQGLLAVGPHQHGDFTKEAPQIVMSELSGQASGVLIQAIGSDVRYTLDGSDPAATGFLLLANAEPMLLGYIPTMTRVTFAGQAGGSVVWQAVRRV